ncbi:hypothetical protein AB833_01780 [Chromatiales bacterium (ex Bugula neritina AB1)]|nr:hypothetical protein AB833_01780 [Chromatiales bacterium (ex Bugula neritina AB1)]
MLRQRWQQWPRTSGIRPKQCKLPDHLLFLQNNAEKINAAGPLQNSKKQAAGGLWTVSASDETEVRQLIEADPFWPTGLRKSVTVLIWNRVFADGKCLITS